MMHNDKQIFPCGNNKYNFVTLMRKKIKKLIITNFKNF